MDGLAQDAASETLTRDSETSTLIIGQPQSPPAQLRPQGAVLFAEERDHVVLLMREPSDQCCQHHLERNHPPSLRQRGARPVSGHYVLYVTAGKTLYGLRTDVVRLPR